MTSDWRPTASRASLERRAHLLAVTRAFFADRGVLEVETPVLGRAPVPDLHLDSFAVPTSRGTRWLQTSPEYAMKRLLAAGSGPIYQISKAFRDGEVGRRHNPEFTLLEWYRPGFDFHALMDEMDAYLATTLVAKPAERRSYGEIFHDALGIDPHRATAAELEARGVEAGLDAPADLDRDDRLQLLLAHCIEPELGRADGPGLRPTFLYDFPASQAALARIRDDPGRPPVAERFEVFLEGMELANGFHELTDAAEQRRRFEAELDKRRAAGKPALPLDERFLAALETGLPDCAGVALGLDRLVMLAVGADRLEDVLAFPDDRA
jgi:lysyl-tRNA synthetase class 2